MLFGSSAAVTITIEVLLTTVGLWFFLQSFRTVSVLFYVAFAAAYTVLAWPMVARGMEVSLFLFFLGLFTRVSVEHLDGKERTLALSALAILAIGARLDAAVFILPTLIVVLGSVRRVLLSMTLVSIAGALLRWDQSLALRVAFSGLWSCQIARRVAIEPSPAPTDGCLLAWGRHCEVDAFLPQLIRRSADTVLCPGRRLNVRHQAWVEIPVVLPGLPGWLRAL